MLHRRIIGYTAATAIIMVGGIVSATYLHSINTDTVSISESVLPRHYVYETTSPVSTFDQLSRFIVSEAYNVSLDTGGQVLGENTETKLNSEQISDMATPAVVRVFSRYTGTIQVHDFTIDLFALRVVPLDQLYTEKVDDAATGTGFIVNEQGYILTNAHVVSEHQALDTFIDKALVYYGRSIESTILDMSEKDQERLAQSLKNRYGSDPETAITQLAQDLRKKVIEYIEKNALVKIDQVITILNPATRGTKISSTQDLKNLIAAGIPAEVIAIEKDFNTTHRDVALLKINESQTPGLTISSVASINSGQKIFVVGYPSNASIDSSDFFSSTITPGSIGSVKELDGVTVYQTDAKISQGSSGGPVMNENGEVVGMMTYTTTGIIGDSFGFAIPISFGLDLMKKNSVSTEQSRYAGNFIAGVALADQQMCRKANASFAAAQETSAVFDAKSKIQKYVDECDTVIAAGNSLDSSWDKTRNWIKNVPMYAWAGVATIIGIIIAALFFFRRYKVEVHTATTLPPGPTIQAV